MFSKNVHITLVVAMIDHTFRFRVNNQSSFEMLVRYIGEKYFDLYCFDDGLIFEFNNQIIDKQLRISDVSQNDILIVYIY